MVSLTCSSSVAAGVHHIKVGNALELSLLDADGDVIADSEGALLMYDKLILKTWPDDGGLLEIKLERM